MDRTDLVIAGGGLTAARAIKSYREAGGGDRIVLAAAEPTLPYHRPPLTKRYLRGETDAAPHVEDEAFYAEHDVDVRLGAPVTALDARRRTVTLDGRPLSFGRLLIATGSSPRRLAVPGADLPGVFSLRTLADSGAIRDAAHVGERAVVVVGGFIGLEAAASLRRRGLDVTLVHVGHGLFDQFGPSALSRDLLALYEDHGVDVRLGEQVSAFGGRGRLDWVETACGDRLEAALAVVGVGAVPNVGFLEGSGVDVDNGVRVDDRFRTNVSGVFAAGDVANFFDPLFGRQRRIEHWSNADLQGREVGKILAGAAGGYDAVSSFFSEVFDTTIRVFGDTTAFDEVHEEGGLADGLVARYVDADGRVVGAVSVGAGTEREEALKDLIRTEATAARGGFASVA